MLRLACTLGTFLIVAILTPLTQALALSADDATRIDGLAQQTIAKSASAGLVVGIAEQGKPTFVRAYGLANIEWKEPTTPDTVFRIGSITKQFAAVCVLLLAEQKKLSLDDKLAKFFPEFPRSNEVTLRHLLNHNSGIHSYPDAPERAIVRTGIGVKEMVQHLATLGYDFDPGSKWAYSNSGYFLIGAVIEQVSGQTFREFAQQRLFRPLGLRHTAVDTNEEIVLKRASGHVQDAAKAGQFLNASYSHMSVPHAAGAIRSTALDLIQWTTALHGGKVLSANSYNEMIAPAPHTGAEEGAYGMGLHLWEMNGYSFIGHNGGIDGFQSCLYYVPTLKMTIVVLSNTQGGAVPLADDLKSLLLTSPAK